ncbi:MAG: F0F1 ATP synthase subunit delta [Candidatus Pacebacteria bacterium]|nr:F0F1 ATP synthase subunit delta [Candidatus Paceibacterota bacterium]
MKTEKEISCWARALIITLEKDPNNFEAIFENLKSSLGKKINYLPAIIKKVERIYNKEKKATLFLSHNLENKEDIKEKIKREVKGIEKIEDVLDESLLGGFRLRTKDVLIKASVKDTLIKLKNKIYGYN